MNPQDPYLLPSAFQQPSGPGPPSTLSNLDQFLSLTSSDETQGGWDFTFSPPLDSKYECPICLMCLRDPWQTSCGHRFCKFCIQRSLREAGPRCPVDNEPLSKQTMFPDGFAKREIMSLLAFCPYRDKGCQEKVELRVMLAHEEECPFQTIRCTNLCGQEVCRLSFEKHIRVLCPKIPVTCEMCRKPIAKDMLEKHHENCSKASIQCQHCGQAVLRENETVHINKDCPNVIVSCRYKPFGCQQAEMLRNRLELHMKEAIHHHMACLASGLEQLNVTSTRRLVETDDYGDYCGIPNNPTKSEFGATASLCSKTFKGKTDFHYDPEGKGQSGSGGSLMPSVPSLIAHKDSYSSQEISQFLESVSRWIHATQDKDRKQQKKIQELEQKVVALDKIRKHEINRNCNGTFIWKLTNYKKMREDASNGTTSVQHSDGFYTAIYGYRLCIRVNINATDTIRGAYISLFVHFMKGDYDNIVDWPFRGSISLSILDQTEDCSKRKHLRETLIAKSELLAFHRPTLYRNHKGFGYMEFAPLSVLENGSYVVNDAFLIKVEVNTG